MKTDQKWMSQALCLAEKGFGWTQPNPCVGAVIVKNGRKLGEGYHRKAGLPHAEVEAIAAAQKKGHSLKNATMFVTLEPCSTYGKTAPCTEAIIQSGISRVVVGATDPNPKHAGRGYGILRNAGIRVTVGVMAEACERLNRAFNHWILTGRPWVIAKAAMTLDGSLVLPGRKWLSCAESRREVHRLRAGCGAVLIGARTARADDPRLTIRGVKHLCQPWRVVVAGKTRLSRGLKLFTDKHRSKTLVYRHKNWNAILRDLGKRGVSRLLVEGGGKVLDSLARGGWIQEVWIYYTPHVADEAAKDVIRADAFRQLPLSETALVAVGTDLRLTGLCD